MGSDTEADMTLTADLTSYPHIEQYVVDDSSDESQDMYLTPDLSVGLMNKAFETLHKASQENNKSQKTTVCNLLIGEIKLAQQYQKYNGKIFGYTEGIGKDPLHEPKKMASKAVIFMVISLTENWKIPVGLFFVHNPDIKYFADTIEETLKRLIYIDIEVVSVTLNCISPHLSFALAEELGAEIDSSKPLDDIKAYFKHPITDKLVHILYDLDIVLGFLKSHWGTERVLHYKTKTLDYSFCVDVKKIQEADLQHYGNEAKFDWIIIKKRLSYDTNSLGKTMADAMQYLKDLGHPDFKKSGPTIQFIRILDLMTQISKVNGQTGEVYLDLSQSNEKNWKPLVLNILLYTKHLKSFSKDQDIPEHLSVFKTYITGISVYFTSLLDIYSNYVNKEDKKNTSLLPSILPSRFGLKHIRLGLLENPPDDMDETALSMFQKMTSFIEKLHLIDVS